MKFSTILPARRRHELAVRAKFRRRSGHPAFCVPTSLVLVRVQCQPGAAVSRESSRCGHVETATCWTGWLPGSGWPLVRAGASEKAGKRRTVDCTLYVLRAACVRSWNPGAIVAVSGSRAK